MNAVCFLHKVYYYFVDELVDKRSKENKEIKCLSDQCVLILNVFYLNNLNDIIKTNKSKK